jgi:hypothetical protein
MAFLEEQLLRLGPDSFAAEHLGVWCPPPDDGAPDAKIPAEAWDRIAGQGITNPVPGNLTIGFAVAPNGARASIGMAVGSISAPTFQVIDERADVGWLPGRIAELVERWKPTVLGCNGQGATGAQVGPVLAALRSAGLTDEVVQLGASEWARGSQALFTAIVEGAAVRRADQVPLDEAVAIAGERPVGQGWAWAAPPGRQIAPLESVTAATALLPVADVTPSKPVFAF